MTIKINPPPISAARYCGPRKTRMGNTELDDEVRGSEHEGHGTHEVRPFRNQRPRRREGRERAGRGCGTKNCKERHALRVSRAFGTKDWIIALIVYPSTNAQSLFQKNPVAVLGASP